MGDEVRTRFAPAPSGYVHLGNARTALFNWLFARHHKGKFVLRIDDTDRTRSSTEAVQVIVDSFRWLGLDWDEGPDVGGPHGPYFQSQRSEIYRSYAGKALESRAAYLCYCTPDELEAERKAAREEKRAYVYSGRCRDVSDGERRRLESEGRKPAIRLRMGMIRADEHLSNTPKQIVLCEALGAGPPRFAHVPMVLAPGGGKKMSKREGAVSLDWYRERGYLPSALRNYLARVGWSLDDRSEKLGEEELVKGFSLERVSVSAAALDPDKLLWMNAEYVREMPVPERTEAVIPFLQKEGLVGREVSDETRVWLEKVVEAIGERLKVLSDVVSYAGFLFVDEVEYDPKAVRKRLLKKGALEIVRGVRDALATAERFDEKILEKVVREFAERREVSAAAVIHPIRVAVTGKAVGPGIFEVLNLLGREKTLRRLDTTARLLEEGSFCEDGRLTR